MRHGEQVSRKPRSNEDHENNQIRSVAQAAQVVQAAQQALRLPGPERPALLVVLAADWPCSRPSIGRSRTPPPSSQRSCPTPPLASCSAFLVSACSPPVVTARRSVTRTATATPRPPTASGLVPVTYQSACRTRPRTGISREGSVELRRAIVELAAGSACTTPISSPTGASCCPAASRRWSL